MPAKAFVIQFPDGDHEYVMRRRPLPSVGDQIRHGGSVWTVARTVNDDVPTVFVVPVERAERPNPKPSGVRGRECGGSRLLQGAAAGPHRP